MGVGAACGLRTSIGALSTSTLRKGCQPGSGLGSLASISAPLWWFLTRVLGPRCFDCLFVVIKVNNWGCGFP